MTSMPLEWLSMLALMAGLSIPAGALISSKVFLNKLCRRAELDSFVYYFGGGALLAAIALVLIPRRSVKMQSAFTIRSAELRFRAFRS